MLYLLSCLFPKTKKDTKNLSIFNAFLLNIYNSLYE